MQEGGAFSRVNDYVSVSIRLASPEDIRSWSYGEVKKPETINYRTYRPEKDGLFCERIFGPERDWECFCGKYKGIKHKGIVCDRCGVMITHSRVRRKRMGHINLAAPVAHIWFFKAMPSRLGSLLGFKTSQLERVMYFQDYVVIDSGGNADLEGKDGAPVLLNEESYRKARERFGTTFEADMGAEAIRRMLVKLDLASVSEDLRKRLRTTHSKQKEKDLIKRLKTVEMLRDSENRPPWMILEVIPVIPPDLRPLVLLESGNFATSDLNDLYRRLINRNNRLKKLLDLNAPEVIIRNEKRMLQQSVDALFDNGRCRRAVLGTSNRPLKSLTDMIKGKQGRFRENLLGKRVDYSARSVIVVGPELKLRQCGLPKKIALELFQPFIIRRLKELGYADTIKSAKKMLERREEEVWDILEEVIKNHPVLLNRAPTLHRMGIQAFEPVLVEGNAIRIHPLVCTGFNADFDGDQMAVHLPLSYEAQVEARTLMLSTNNIFSPAHGGPIISPTQDIVLGCYYLTVSTRPEEDVDPKAAPPAFADRQEAIMAYVLRKVGTHTKIRLRLPEGTRVRHRLGVEDAVDRRPIETTPGRVLFNDVLPEGMPFFNYAMHKKALQDLIQICHGSLGRQATLELLDSLKELGFKSATLGGLSFSKNDMRIPAKKDEILKKTDKEVSKLAQSYRKGLITEGERYNQVIDLWTHARERIGEEMMAELAEDTRDDRPYLNPIYLMVSSGARGSLDQVRQLAGMRGLMAKPSGRIIETPIKANFREGLRVLEYFSSTHGARKGLADTALKTADSGYLTRKLADVAQNVVVTEYDCGALGGVDKAAPVKGDRLDVPLSKKITGRVARDNIVDVVTDEVIVKENELITKEIAQKIEARGYTKVRVRSALTCEAPLGLCAKCYGMDLSRGRLVEVGLAVGIMAAQSIGEPGTQLTMRTFHIGGIASRHIEESELQAKRSGSVKFQNLKVATNREGEPVILSRGGEILVVDHRGRELERFENLPAGAVLKVEEGAKVQAKTMLARWDAHNDPILGDRDGVVFYEDIVEGKTMKREKDPGSGVTRKVILEHKGDLHPQIVLKDADENVLAYYPLPEKAHVEVEEGDEITAGTLLAKTPRGMSQTQDITGGLPRVTELFEARRPKDAAVIAKISGKVELGEKRRGKRTVVVKHEASGTKIEHAVPPGKHLRVHASDHVNAGDPLVEGPLDIKEYLEIAGEERVYQYLVREVQNVYRAQGVTIDDKHIEVIVTQMLRRVSIEDSGDTSFLRGAVVDKFRFRAENERIRKQSLRPATAKTLLIGITKASLQSDSFISAASFQETTKVLTEAALAGRHDELRGLKENVILGHMVPTGTGFREYLRTRVKKSMQWAASALAVGAESILGASRAADGPGELPAMEGEVAPASQDSSSVPDGVDGAGPSGSAGGAGGASAPGPSITETPEAKEAEQSTKKGS